MSLNEKLCAIRMADPGLVHQAVANQFHATPKAISEIVQSRQTLEKLEDSPTKWKNLDLNVKLKARYFMLKHNRAAKSDHIRKINHRTVLRC